MIFTKKLDFWNFDEDIMVYKDGSLGAAFEVNGVDIECEDVSVINDINQNIEKMINSLSKALFKVTSF